MDSLTTHKRIIALEIIFVLFVFAYALWSLVRIISTTAPDFSVLYGSARLFLERQDLYSKTPLYTGLGYPPVSLLPFLPFSIFSYFFAQAIWTLGSFGAMLGSIFLCLQSVKKFTWWKWAMVSSLVFLSFPTKFTLGMGQANFYALGFMLLGVSDLPIHPYFRSFALGMALLLKPHLLLVYVGLLFTKQKWPVIWSMVSVAVLTIVLGISNNWGNEISYITNMAPVLMKFEGRAIYYNQGIQSFIERTVGNSGALISQALSILVLSISYGKLFKMKSRDPFIVLGLLSPMLLLVEPLSWQHHTVFLLPTFISVWKTFIQKKRVNLWVWILAASFLLISWNIKNPLNVVQNGFGAVVLSHGFIGVLFVWLLSLWYL